MSNIKGMLKKVLSASMACLMVASSFVPSISAKEQVQAIQSKNDITVAKKSKKGMSPVKKFLKYSALAGGAYVAYMCGKAQGRKEVIVDQSTNIVDFLYNILESKPEKWTHSRKYYFIRLVEGLANYDKQTTSKEDAERLARYLILTFFPKDKQHAVTMSNMIQIPNDILRHVCEDVTREVIDINAKEAAKREAVAAKDPNRGLWDCVKSCCVGWLRSIVGYVAPNAIGKATEGAVDVGGYVADWALDFNDEDFLNNEGNIFGVKVGTYKEKLDKVTFGTCSEKIGNIPNFNAVNVATRRMVENMARKVIPVMADYIQKYGKECFDKCYLKLAEANNRDYFTNDDVGFDGELFAEGQADPKWYHGLQFLNERGLAQFVYTVSVRVMAQKLVDRYQDHC